MSFQRLPRKRGEKVIFFFENLSLLPETRQVMEHFKLVFGSGNSDLAKIRPLNVWTSWISPWVPPYGILPQSKNAIGARALYSPLSLPRIFLHLTVHSATVARSTEKYTEGLHPERSGEGGSSLHGQTCPCIEHKGPPSTKNMHTKTAMTPVVATIS